MCLKRPHFAPTVHDDDGYNFTCSPLRLIPDLLGTSLGAPNNRPIYHRNLSLKPVWRQVLQGARVYSCLHSDRRTTD